MENRPSILSIIQKIIFGLACLLIIWQLYTTFSKRSADFSDPVKYIEQYKDQDFITKYGERFHEIKNYFPEPSHIGYCSEPNQDKPSYYLHYTLTQYYLAPHIISTSTDKDTILYNLYESMQLNEAVNFHLMNGWHVLKNFNNGLIILAK